mmetsp:Transcript_21572/g.58011  ORF Transcript_21572/g.58011 Transcript_21572/m.58011 type:complete len:220 (+) Transcript_21572:89-748(+)
MSIIPILYPHQCNVVCTSGENCISNRGSVTRREQSRRLPSAVRALGHNGDGRRLIERGPARDFSAVTPGNVLGRRHWLRPRRPPRRVVGRGRLVRRLLLVQHGRRRVGAVLNVRDVRLLLGHALVGGRDPVRPVGSRAVCRGVERVLEHEGEHLRHVVRKFKSHLLEHIFRELRQVLLVARGQDDAAQSRAVRGHHLLLDAAHGEDEAAQSDLSSHGRV